MNHYTRYSHCTPVTVTLRPSLILSVYSHHCHCQSTPISVIITEHPSVLLSQDNHQCNCHRTTISVIVTGYPSVLLSQNTHQYSCHRTPISVTVTGHPSVLLSQDTLIFTAVVQLSLLQMVEYFIGPITSTLSLLSCKLNLFLDRTHNTDRQTDQC